MKWGYRQQTLLKIKFILLRGQSVSPKYTPSHPARHKKAVYLMRIAAFFM